MTAHIPTKKRIKEIQSITKKAIDKKGKDFKPHGGGVLPEKIWKGLKK